ncbi:hypothetical protein RB653_001591 [Dictyostelium firmibasis]|uniref:Uncharacterized protein n=1 Tax=Dictyostelium firmibasis TaxID=79012 RepID=A0AAN7Z285_9MYCE
MLTRFSRTAIKNGRYFSTSAKTTTPLTDAEEVEILKAVQAPEFKEASKKSREQYKEIISKLTSEEGKSITQSTGVKPTINISSPSGKIAHALFDAASSMRSIGIVSKELAQVKTIIEKTPGFKAALEGEIDNSEKSTMVELLQNTVSLSPVSGFFLYFMTYEQNFKLINPTLNDFKRLVASLDSEMSIRLTVAHQYTETERNDLEKNVKSFFPPETTFKFSYIVDPAIEKGFIIESPFINHDASYATAVKKVQSEEQTVFTEFLNDIKNGIKTQTAVWETKDFKEKYLTFDEKAYDAKI